MDPKDPPQRRRGAALDDALLDAAWTELVEVGYAHMTFEAVAHRAHTSRPVVYRRWATKAELVEATLRHSLAKRPVVTPDTGNLRDDVIALLMDFGVKRADMFAVFTIALAAYFEETGTRVADVRNMLQRGAPSHMESILERAVARGEIASAAINPRVAQVPGDLLRHELLMGSHVTQAIAESIVDDVFLPLLYAVTVK